MIEQLARIVIEELDQDRFESVCGWFTTLPNYMFSPGLSAQLLAFAYRNEDPEKTDNAGAQCLYIKAHFEPLAPNDFIALCEQLYRGFTPKDVKEFHSAKYTLSSCNVKALGRSTDRSSRYGIPIEPSSPYAGSWRITGRDSAQRLCCGRRGAAHFTHGVASGDPLADRVIL